VKNLALLVHMRSTLHTIYMDLGVEDMMMSGGADPAVESVGSVV
jgi:hypothetical protein